MAKKNGSSEAVTVYQGGDMPGVGVASPDTLADVLAGGEVLPPIISLDEEGKYIDGKVLGSGQEVDYTDAAGDQRKLHTWRFELANGFKVDVLSAHQLDKSLPDLVGHRVAVVKGKTKKVGARQVNQYLISDKGAA